MKIDEKEYPLVADEVAAKFIGSGVAIVHKARGAIASDYQIYLRRTEFLALLALAIPRMSEDDRRAVRVMASEVTVF